MSRIRKVVIPAAGIGSRFYPLTRAQPKEMLPILDKPVIHYVVEEAITSGIEQILIVVGYGKDAIMNYFDKSPLDIKLGCNDFNDLPAIYFVRQKSPAGLADALRYSEAFVGDEPFVVLLGDTIYHSYTDRTATRQLIDTYYEHKKPCLMVEKVPEKKFQDYGIIDPIPFMSNLYKIRKIIEKPTTKNAPSDLGSTGIYILNPTFFSYLKQTRPGVDGEYQLADVFNMIIADEEMLAVLLKGRRYDVGTKESWVRTFVEFAREDDRFKEIFGSV